MRNLISLLISLSLSPAFAFNSATKEITIGTTVGDFSDMVKEGVKPELEKKGYQVKLVEFTDYVNPNLALSEGSLDLNIFQHRPYLEQFSKEKHLQLTPVAPVPTAPLGLYAGKAKSLNDVKKGSKVAVPNDPTNLARALVILSDLGWIQLSKKIDPLKVHVGDIAVNTKEIEIVQLEAAQLPRSLADVDYAVINGNYATSAGIQLTSALSGEKSDAYINWAVTKTQDINSTYVRDIVAILNSTSFKKFARSKFKGYKFPSKW